MHVKCISMHHCAPSHKNCRVPPLTPAIPTTLRSLSSLFSTFRTWLRLLSLYCYLCLYGRLVQYVLYCTEKLLYALVHLDVTFHPHVETHVGERVTLNCTSPRDNPSSVTWSYRSSSASNDSTVLVRIEEDRISHFDNSGRLSLNRTVRNTYHLVIYGSQQNESGTYWCSVDVGYEKQHVTVLNATGISCSLLTYLLAYFFLTVYVFVVFTSVVFLIYFLVLVLVLVFQLFFRFSFVLVFIIFSF